MATPDNAPRATRVAHAGRTHHRFFGYDVFEELAGSASFWDIVSISLEGPTLSREDRLVLDDLFGCCTVADPRLPPLKLVRLEAAFGGLMPGFGVGYLALENAFIGPWSAGETAQLLVDIAGALDAGADEEITVEALVAAQLERRSYLPGFGVPFRDHDERVAAVAQCLRNRERDNRRYWRLMRDVESAMLSQKGVSSNIGAAIAASTLDLGFEPHQIPALSCTLALCCILANAFESARQQAPELRSLSPDSAQYLGHPPRSSPRATRARQADPLDPDP
jgi:hypothetical protein